MLLASLLLVVLFISSRFSPSLRHPVDALLLTQGMLDGRGGWLSLLTRVPRRAEVVLNGVSADLYSPRDEARRKDAPSRGCVLLIHGMSAMGKRDYRLSAFAQSLARLGFSVLTPDLPGMKKFRPEEDDVLRIEQALLGMAGGRRASFKKCSLLAFSFAAGPALRAAAKASVRNQVGAFIGVGAYYDLKNVLKHITTSGGENQPAFPGGLPIRHGKWLFLRYNAKLLGLVAFQNRVDLIISRKLEDEEADVSDLMAGLSGRARSLIALMENKAPHRFESLYAQQGAEQRERLRKWGMKDIVPKVRGRKFFLHGRGDPFVPASESILLLNRARETSEEAVSWLILNGFRHVGVERDILSPRRIWEAMRFLGFVSSALSAMGE